MRSPFVLLAAAALASTSVARPAAAQEGYLRIYDHLAGETPKDRVPHHVYFSDNGTLVDRTDLAFAPGSYTIARLEFDISGCTAAATNVSFTISAGQVTEINPLIAFTTCLLRIAPQTVGGYGHVQVSYSNQVVIDCAVTKSASGGAPNYGSFSSCSHSLAYGASLEIRVVPADANSGAVLPGCAPESGTSNVLLCENVKADTTFYQRPPATFTGEDEPDDPSADLEIVRLSSNRTRYAFYSTFRVTNHGPNAVPVSLAYGDTTPRGHMFGAFGPVDGACDRRCLVLIPAGGSVDWFLRSATFFPLNGGGQIILPPADLDCDVVGIVINIDAMNVDPHPADNVTGCYATDVQVAVTPGTSAPPNQTVSAGASGVPVLQFSLNPSSPITLDDITLSASGSGNEAVDVTAVKLFVDKNANGAIDAGDTQLASGSYGSNDGTVTLAVAPPYAVSGATSFLVTYDFNTTLASRFGGAIVLAGLLPVFLMPRRRRRGAAGALLLMLGLGVASLGLGACGGDSTSPTPPPGGSATYTVELTGATVGGATVSGISVHGATISIAR